jgi:hypothetical protein
LPRRSDHGSHERSELSHPVQPPVLLRTFVQSRTAHLLVGFAPEEVPPGAYPRRWITCITGDGGIYVGFLEVSQRRPSLVWSYDLPVAVIVAVAIEAGVTGRWLTFAVLIVLLVAAGVGGYTIHLARRQRGATSPSCRSGPRPGGVGQVLPVPHSVPRANRAELIEAVDREGTERVGIRGRGRLVGFKPGPPLVALAIRSL